MSLPDSIAKRLQSDVQAELERREWAEPGDNVMAEYVCVLLANGNTRERVQTEMDDLVGSDFDPSFLDWLFQRRDALVEEAAAPAAPAPSVPQEPASATAAEPSAPSAASRMFASAVEGTKRKAEPEVQEPSTRRRLPDGPLGAPTGPRSMRDRELLPDRPQDRRDGGRSLMDRLGPQGGPRGMPPRPGMNMTPRGGLNGRGPMNGGPGFRPPFGQQPMNQGMMMPGQEQMMMQMMAMQANMAQMAQQMAKMSEEKPQRPVRPPRGAPSKPAFAGKSSAASTPSSKNASTGAIPDRPLSSALCKFGVGCTNARCTYSHPSPVADEKSGMVLSEEACEAGKDCKDPECIKSHVSPAAVLGAGAGPSRILCKFQNCTNPACQFRHEDAEGNFIPPPALGKAAPPSSSQGDSRDDDVEVVVKASLDEALDDSHHERPCRYGERCTRADCKFTHPASRPVPRGGKAPVRGRPRPAAPEGIAGGMTPSRKFAAPAAESKLNPAAGEFKPAAAAAEKELGVSM